MKRIDPDLVFIVGLILLAVAMAFVLSCGGAQRRDCAPADAMGRGSNQPNPCTENR